MRAKRIGVHPGEDRRCRRDQCFLVDFVSVRQACQFVPDPCRPKAVGVQQTGERQTLAGAPTNGGIETGVAWFRALVDPIEHLGEIIGDVVSNFTAEPGEDVRHDCVRLLPDPIGQDCQRLLLQHVPDRKALRDIVPGHKVHDREFRLLFIVGSTPRRSRCLS